MAHFSEDRSYHHRSLKRHVTDGLPWMGLAGCNPGNAGDGRTDRATTPLETFARPPGAAGSRGATSSVRLFRPSRRRSRRWLTRSARKTVLG